MTRLTTRTAAPAAKPEILTDADARRAAKLALQPITLPDYRGGRNYPKLPGDA